MMHLKWNKQAKQSKLTKQKKLKLDPIKNIIIGTFGFKGSILRSLSNVKPDEKNEKNELDVDI